MSNNLNAPQVATNQANKETTINTMYGALDAVMTEALAVSASAGDVVLTAAQQDGNGLIRVTNATVAGRKLTVLARKRSTSLIIYPDATCTQNVTLALGTATFIMQPGFGHLVYLDGTANGLVVFPFAGASGSIPYDIGTYVDGKPAASEKVMRLAITRSITIPVNASGSVAKAGVAATGAVTFVVRKNGVNFCNIDFAAGATTGVFTAASASSLVAGDILEIVAPGVQDATLADISITLAGVR